MQELLTTLPVGSLLCDRYVVEGLLGKGGFGAVYLVKDLRVKGNLFALKEAINPPKKDLERFLFEGELLKRLDHRSLPRVYRVFEDNLLHRAYMLMDYIEGSNLEALRLQQPDRHFPLSEVLSMLAPIVEAVNYLHKQNPPVLHRDIKPSNIIVPVSGDAAVLVDFGIAKEYDPDGTTTAVRTGSPGFAAPEQYSTGTSTRSDIYGLGATFYTLLTGSIPADALYRITHMGEGHDDPLEPVNKLAPGIPQHAAEAIHRALAINSNHRFSTVEHFWRTFYRQPMWRPLNVPAIAPSSQPLPVQKQIDTPLPTTLEHEQPLVRHARKSRILLLALLALLVASAIWAGSLAYLASHPTANSPAPTSITVTTAISPTSRPPQVPTTAAPTPHPKAVSTIQPSGIPTPFPTTKPTPFPTPSPYPAPTPTSTPTPLPYPNLSGNYNGTIDDTTDNITTAMALSIHHQSSQGNINGYLTINPPLVGSGNFTGTIDTTKYIQFTVQAYKKNEPLYFWGWVQSDGSLKGDYCSLNTQDQNNQNQCDPNAGPSGTWDVVPS